MQDFSELMQQPTGALVLVEVRADEAGLYNRFRPRFAQMGLRVVLWMDPATAESFRAEAPDFDSWVSRHFRLEGEVPAFTLTLLRQQSRIHWTGQDLEMALHTLGAVVQSSWDLNQKLQAQPMAEYAALPGWKCWEGATDPYRVERVIEAMGQGIDPAVMVGDGVSPWPPVHDQLALLESAALLGCPQPTLAVALLDREPEAVALLATLLGDGVVWEEITPVLLDGTDPDPALSLARRYPGRAVGPLSVRAGHWRAEVYQEELGQKLSERLVAAEVRRTGGDFVGARQDEEGVLEWARGRLGEEHPVTLAAKHDLATTLGALGDLAGARVLQEQVVDARRRILVEDHPQTLSAMNNLAVTMQAQGDFQGADELLSRVLDAHRRIRGEESPETLKIQHNLAALRHTQGDLLGAHTLLKSAWETRQRVLGPDDPETLRSLEGLAVVAGGLGDLSAARQWMEQVVAAGEKSWKEGDSRSLGVRSNLAAILVELGELEEAGRLLEQVLERQKQLLPVGHPDILRTGERLAILWQRAGDPGRAVPLLREVVAEAQRRWGSDHPDGLRFQSNLAVALSHAGNHAEAKSLLKQILSVAREKYGDRQPLVLSAVSNLAAVALASGSPAECLEILGTHLDAIQEVFGPEAPTSLRAMFRMVQAHAALGQAPPAELLAPLESLAIRDPAMIDAWHLRDLRSQFLAWRAGQKQD